MNGLVLHLRSRGVAGAAVVLVAVSIGFPLLDRWLPLGGGAGPTLPLQALAAAAGVAVLGAGLTGADPDLETSTPRTGPRLRTGFLVIGLICVTLFLVIGAALVLSLPPATLALVPGRDVAAVGGLTALVATVTGVRLSWLLPTTWVLVVLGADPSVQGWLRLVSLPVLPADTGPALLAAALLLAAGTIVYARTGAGR